MFRAIWVYDNLLSNAECDRVEEFFLKKSVKPGEVYNYETPGQDEDIRNNYIKWGNRYESELEWLFKKLDQAMHNFNRLWFDVDYDRDGCDSIQFSIYEKDQYYKEHSDTVFIENDLTHRKLSCSVLISDPSEFSGGEFYINGGALAREDMKRGQIYAFPSLIDHEVAKVESGVRKSLVAWYMGRAWR